MPILVDKYVDGNLKVNEFVTHTMPLQEINKAFELMHKGKRFVEHGKQCILLYFCHFLLQHSLCG